MSRLFLKLLVSIIAAYFPTNIKASITISVQVVNNKCSMPTTIVQGLGAADFITVNGVSGAITVDPTKAAFSIAHTGKKKCKGTLTLSSFKPDTSANQEYASGTYSIQVLTPATDGSGPAASPGDVLGTFTLSGKTASFTSGSVILQENSITPQTFKLVEIKPGVVESADLSFFMHPEDRKPIGVITVVIG